MKINIFLLDNGGDIWRSLAFLEKAGRRANIAIFCAYGSLARKDEFNNVCEKLLKSGAIASYGMVAGSDGFFAANSLFLSAAGDELLFFLSTQVELSPAALAVLTKRLELEPETAGLNPVFMAAWLDKAARIANMGIVCDCQKYLHYLYEGLPSYSQLAQKRRFFQMAHPGACLIRLEDFIAANGFNCRLKYAAWPSFCMALGRIRVNGFSTEPACRVFLHDKFDSWKFCGTWNSGMQTGRIITDGLESDYVIKAAEDGLGYKLDAWLCEYADGIPLEPDDQTRDWLTWRYGPNPLSFMKFVGSLPEDERVMAFELATAFPSSLPQTFTFYKAQCAKIMEYACAANLDWLKKQCAKWEGKSRRFHYSSLRPGIELLKKTGLYNCSLNWSTAVYPAWIETGEKFPELRVGDTWPEIAVLMPVWNPNPEYLIQAIDSVRAQKYGNFQLCIADDASTNPDIAGILHGMAREDSRIRLIFRESNGHICAASNSALDLVNAPYTAFMDQDDMIAPEALGTVAACVADNPGYRYLYSDMDLINGDNTRSGPVFKPDFDGDLIYTGHLSIYATACLKEAGGLRPGMEGSQDFDLCLRVTEKLKVTQIGHIPHILYHWRQHKDSTSTSLTAKPYVLEATKRAWLDYAKRNGHNSTIVNAGCNNYYILSHELPKDLACGIILLVDGQAPEPTPELAQCLADLRDKIPMEIFIQPLDSGSPKAQPIGGISGHRLPHAGSGWIKACNAAARICPAPIILFLYAGIRPLPKSRLEQLIYHAAREDLAMAGGLAWHKGFLVNGGWYPDVTGRPFKLLYGTERQNLSSYVWGQYLSPRHTLGVSWQCMAARKVALLEDGFLNESLGELALVEFSTRNSVKGKNTLTSPWAQWECQWPEQNPSAKDMNMLASAWGKTISASGIRNPNLRRAPDNGWTLIF